MKYVLYNGMYNGVWGGLLLQDYPPKGLSKFFIMRIDIIYRLLELLYYNDHGFFTGPVDGSLGERPAKEAFVSSGNDYASPKSQMSTSQKQVSDSNKLQSYGTVMLSILRK